MNLKNVFFTLITVTVFFGASELILAAIGVRPALLTEDPFVGFSENIPQFVEATGADGSAIYKTANNKRGLFNYQEFPKEKGSNTYRIFCMGGSTTYGRPYGDMVSFCGWLREYLRAADTTRNWEVINAGGISFASYRVAKLMNELKNYQPDLFIVYSGQNEFLEQRSYGKLASLPSWLINLNATLSGTRIYTVMKDMIDAVESTPDKHTPGHYEMSGEVDEILNHTMGPESYHRDEVLKQEIITHYRLNLIRMARIASDSGAGMILVKPARNLKDMSPFKSEHREGLGKQELAKWNELFRQGTDLFDAGDIDGALQAYQQALTIDDRYADLHFRMGQAWFKLKQYDKAEQSFRRAVEEDIAPLRILASMQNIVEDVAASEDVPLIDFPDIIRKAYREHYDFTIFGNEYFPDHVHANIEGYRLLGLALFDQLVKEGVANPSDDWDEARIEATSQNLLARIDPRAEGHTMLNLGKVLDWAGKYKEAYYSFNRALEILGPSPVLYDRLAMTSFGLGKYDEAILYLNKLLEIAPDFPDVHARLAMVYERQGKIDEAIAQGQAALEAKPDDPSVYGGLAKLFENKGDFDAALRHYQKSLELKPDNDFAQTGIAYLLLRLHRYDEALEHAEEAVRINPKKYQAYNALGIIKINQGHPEEAMQDFSEALRLQPDYTAARKNLQRLQMAKQKKGQDGRS